MSRKYDSDTGEYVDKYYPNGYKGAKPMASIRNSVKVIDKAVPKVTINNLLPGQMFRYPEKSNEQNVYMVIDGHNVVLLSTGTYYMSFNRDREVEVVDAVSISR